MNITSCAGFVNPLNLRCSLVNNLAGSSEIFILLSFIFISGMAARFRMSGLSFFAVLGLFVAIMSLYVGIGVYVLMLLLVSISTFWAIAKLSKR